MEMNYEQMSVVEIIEYYKRVRDYVEKGFRVEGLKDELALISETLKGKKEEGNGTELEQYLSEIDVFLKNIRH